VTTLRLLHAQCLLDHPAEAGERSERKPGVETPRDAVHEYAFPFILLILLIAPI